MEEIEVGDYVRTREGYIDKIIIAENEFDMYAGEKNPQYLDYTSEDILKHSKNIIDLIEEGDYINGEQIDFINVSKEGKKRPLIRDKIYFFDKYNSIKSIVTKEQFNSIAYRLEE